MEAFCASFPPVCDSSCRVLVLGSMPGVASLTAGQYYAHPRNAFWPILYAIWDEKMPAVRYEDRLSFALSHRVAVWDVAKTCLRTASSDASIRDVEANDFAPLFAECPDIRHIFLNGRLAQSLFERLAKGAAPAIPRTLLPSTSPAYTIPYARKMAAWWQVREAAERDGGKGAKDENKHFTVD